MPVTEENLPPIEHLRISPPIQPSERVRWTPMVWELNSKNKILKLSGLTIGDLGNGLTETRRIECKPRHFSDIVDFILKGGTCYLPYQSKFLSILIKSLPDPDKRLLARTMKLSKNGYHIKLTQTCLLVRQGNNWGRVYSFWPAIPKSIAENLDRYDKESLTLDEFVKIFVLVTKPLQEQGYSICTLHSSASIVSTSILGSRAKLMFGNLDSVPFEVLEDAHQAYKGARFEGSINQTKECDYWDIVAAHPSIGQNLLPCDGKHMLWKLVKDIPEARVKEDLLKRAFYAFLLCYVVPTNNYQISPILSRYLTPLGYRLAGLLCPEIVRLTLPEYKLLVTKGLASVDILGGSYGIPLANLPRLKGPIESMVGLKTHPILGRLMSSASQVLIGKMGSMWTDHIEEWGLDLHLHEKIITRTSPLFGLIYASHTSGQLRADITEYALKYGATFVRADGFGCPVGTIVSEEGSGIGKLRLKESGIQSNPDDMLWEGPGTTNLLEAIQSSEPDSKTYTMTRKIIRTLRGEYARGRSLSHIGEVDIILEDRQLGSRKRIPKNIPNCQTFQGEGITHSAPKSQLDLDYLKLQGGGYDYC